MLNKYGFITTDNSVISYFLHCYFNDVLGYSGVLVLISYLLTYSPQKVKLNLYHIESFALVCGIFWEYITPLYRKNTTSDILDIFAYMLGGLLYWFFFDARNLSYFNKITSKEDI